MSDFFYLSDIFEMHKSKENKKSKTKHLNHKRNRSFSESDYDDDDNNNDNNNNNDASNSPSSTSNNDLQLKPKFNSALVKKTLEHTLKTEVQYQIKFKEIKSKDDFYSSKYSNQESYIKNISNIKKANISVEDLEYVIFLKEPEPKQIKLEPIREEVNEETTTTNKDKHGVKCRRSVMKKTKYKPNTVKALKHSPNIFSESESESENEVDDINKQQSGDDDVSKDESVINININESSNVHTPNNNVNERQLHFNDMINELTHPKQHTNTNSNNNKAVSISLPPNTSNNPHQHQHQHSLKTYEHSIKQILSQPKTRPNDISRLHTNITTILNAIPFLPPSSPKLNIVFDLDSTLLHSTTNKFPDKKGDRWSLNPNLCHFEITIEQRPFKGICVFRPGLRDFFAKTKSFCNYYIYSMGLDEYAKHLSIKLQRTFNINIICTYGRINTFERSKFLQKIGLTTSNTLIIDDQVEVWNTDNNGVPNANCLINSYKFLSELIIENFSNYTQLDFYPFCYSYTQRSKLFQLLFKFEERNFIIGSNHIPYHVEYEYSKKFQFEYLGELLRKVTTLMNYAHVDAYVALMCIKSTVLLGVKVYMGFVQDCNKRTLLHMIETCGGEVFDYLLHEELTHVVVSWERIEEYNEMVNRLISKDKAWEKVHFVNAKWVVDCFYCVSRMNEKDECYMVGI